jgi:GAF domain-containing protein
MPGAADDAEAAGRPNRARRLTARLSGCHDVAVTGPDEELDAGRAGFSAPAGHDALRLQQLARVTIELGAAESIEEIADAAVEHVAAAIRAAVTTLMVRENDVLTLVGGHNLRPGVSEQWHSFPVDHDNPASEALREARPVMLSGVPAIEARWPSLRGQVPAGRSILCLPLGAGSTPVGVAGMTFEDDWLPGPRELDLLTAFAEACGQAVRRVRASAEAEIREQYLSFLADVSAELVRSLDYRATLTAVADLTVPGLADWCAVDIVERDTLSTLSVAHVDPAKVAWAWELQRRYPSDRDAPTGASNVVRTGVSELYEEITDEMLVAGARDQEHLRLCRELHLRSAMVVPLTVRGRTLGAITLIRAETGRAYGPADLLVAEDLGRRAAFAIDNAQLHSQTRDVARQLQRAVLPDDLGALASWQVAVHYEPGGEAEVGGDVYDAVALPDGRLAVFIGDVMGHGVAAAAAMAHLRASVRAFICVDPAPHVVIGHLEQMFELLSISQLVTLVYAVVDPRAGRIELVNAGHYPPLIVCADGSVTFAATPPRRPLGTDPDVGAATGFGFGRGDTLLLFTDGLVERRDEHIDLGLQRLARHATAVADSDLSAGLQRLVARVLGAGGEDDVTAVALRAR